MTLPFEAFKSVYRGRPVINGRHLAPEKICQIGFLLADKNEGLFQLDFTDIEFTIDEQAQHGFSESEGRLLSWHRSVLQSETVYLFAPCGETLNQHG